MDFRQRASQEQFSIMLNYMEMYGDLSRPQPGPQGRLNSERQWSELTELLNSVGGSGVTKSMDKWKRVWSDWKTKTKKKASIININAQGTGGGPSKGKPLNPLEERILNIIGLQSITGHQEVEEAGFLVVTSPIVPSNTTPIIIAEIQGETCTPSAVPLSPEPSGMDISMPSTSQTTHAIQRDMMRSPGPSTPRRSSPGPSPRRQRTVGLRRRRRQTPFERATAEFASIEERRLRLEEKRLENEHVREMERLRIDELRVTMEERRTTVIEKFATDIKDLLSQRVSL